jgi:amidase
MATTVEDLALMLDVLAGSSVRQLPSTDGLRIAVSDEPSSLVRVTVEEPLAAGWRRAVETFERAGADVRHATPPYPAYLGRALATRAFMGVEYDVERVGIDRRRVGPRTRTVLRLARVAERLAPLRPEEADGWKRDADEFFATHDALVTPATGTTAFPHRDWHAKGLLRVMPPTTRFAAFSSPWNLADLPAAAVPMGIAPDGLPVAVQVVGGRGREDLVLAVASLLEREHPWPRHAPGWLVAPAGSDVNR